MRRINLVYNKKPSTRPPFSYNPRSLTDPIKTNILPPEPSKSSKDPITRLTEADLSSHDTDLWIIFDNPHLKTPPHDVVISLKNQFESTNIVKITQAFYLETCLFYLL